MDSHTIAVQKEIPTTVKLSAYLNEDNVWAVAIAIAMLGFVFWSQLDQWEKEISILPEWFCFHR